MQHPRDSYWKITIWLDSTCTGVLSGGVQWIGVGWELEGEEVDLRGVVDDRPVPRGKEQSTELNR